MQTYSLCSAILMCQKRRIECETFKREGDIDSALLALESSYYWKERASVALDILSYQYRVVGG